MVPAATESQACASARAGALRSGSRSGSFGGLRRGCRPRRHRQAGKQPVLHRRIGVIAIRTGTRCTILVKLPAFCAGSSANCAPVPGERLSILPLSGWPGSASTSISTLGPGASRPPGPPGRASRPAGRRSECACRRDNHHCQIHTFRHTFWHTLWKLPPRQPGGARFRPFCKTPFLIGDPHVQAHSSGHRWFAQRRACCQKDLRAGPHPRRAGDRCLWWSSTPTSAWAMPTRWRFSRTCQPHRKRRPRRSPTCPIWLQPQAFSWMCGCRGCPRRRWHPGRAR